MSLVALAGILLSLLITLTQTHLAHACAINNGCFNVLDGVVSENTPYESLLDINSSVVNNNPAAAIIVTPNVTPFGDFEETLLNEDNIGVYYHAGTWSIFNQDHTNIQQLSSFNVYATTDPKGSLVHTASAANISSYITYIDNPLTNNHPDLELFVTPNWSGAFDDHPLGVWYDGIKWSIFHEDLTPISSNESFNVAIKPKNSGKAFIHTATAANTSSYQTCINNPIVNNNVSLLLHVTPDWTTGPVYTNSNYAVAYNQFTNEWCIESINLKPIPVGTAFNVFSN
ncbi:hypothetical protein KTT_57190 [Tengunoibacter tsumagoiensis]|uniref:DUF7452 domain-containing protein n=2 Tax=Tengunoibacter tsumagoiensis TaxID=2014871 RepID=A0A402A9P2_9CHLR|nr:hypothetical protein KTT_57190 [Tengunoibacter tsumagoiensis]